MQRLCVIANILARLAAVHFGQAHAEPLLHSRVRCPARCAIVTGSVVSVAGCSTFLIGLGVAWLAQCACTSLRAKVRELAQRYA
eukprot:6172104-Pleurochrysis_carterae.AAC.2